MREILLVLLLLPQLVVAQDIYGRPLPETISQSTYDRVKANKKMSEDGAVNHWVSCGRYAEVLEDIITNLQEQEKTFNCTRNKTWREDGSLWKPVSNRGTPVVLLPCENLDFSVDVYNNGVKISEGVDRGYCANPNAKNPLGRSHFEIKTKAVDLPKSKTLQVVATFPDGSTECRFVNDPTKRQE